MDFIYIQNVDEWGDPILKDFEKTWCTDRINDSDTKFVNAGLVHELIEALENANQMLSGCCKHGHDTSRSARGCDFCAEEIEKVFRCNKPPKKAPVVSRGGSDTESAIN